MLRCGFYLFVIYTLPTFTKRFELANNKRHIYNKVVMYVEIEDQNSYGKEKGKRVMFAICPSSSRQWKVMLQSTLSWTHQGVLSRVYAIHPSLISNNSNHGGTGRELSVERIRSLES